MIREAVRVLLVTREPEPRVLLLAAQDPERFWFPPGGGLEAGEDVWAAARREVREETGLALDDAGVEVWHRRHAFVWRGVEHDQRERWLLARVAEPFALDRGGWTAGERADVSAARWFTVAELERCEERLVPADLAARLSALLRDGAPGAPVEVGV